MGAIVFDEVQVIDLLRSNPVQVRSQPIERGDNMALRWTVDVRLGGKSVPSEGLAFAVYCARSDGVTVRGDDIQIEGSKIVTMIPQDAANVPGPVVCMLRLSGTDGENAALAWLSLTAVDTAGEAIIDQGTRLPSLEEMMAQTLRAAEAADKAEAAAGRAEAAIANAAGAAGAANTAAGKANAAAGSAQAAAAAIEGMQADAQTLDAGADPTVDVVRGEGTLLLHFGIPAGPPGAVPRITFEVATGEPDTDVQVEQSGTAEAPVVRLTIPRGKTGAVENMPFGTQPPAALGEASAGAADTVARSDHVHPMPSAADVGALSSTYTPPVKSVNGETGAVEVTRIKGNDNSYAKVDYANGHGAFVTTVFKNNILVSFRVKGDGKIPQVRYQDGDSITVDNIYTQTLNPPKIGVVGAKEGHVAVFDSSGNIVSSGKSFWDFTRAKMTLSGTTLTITTLD